MQYYIRVSTYRAFRGLGILIAFWKSLISRRGLGSVGCIIGKKQGGFPPFLALCPPKKKTVCARERIKKLLDFERAFSGG